MNRIVDRVLPAPLSLHHRTWRLLLLNHELPVCHHSATKHTMHLRVHVDIKQLLVRCSVLIRVWVDHTDVLQLRAVDIVHGTSSVRRKRQVCPVPTHVDACSHRVPFVTAVLILELPRPVVKLVGVLVAEMVLVDGHFLHRAVAVHDGGVCWDVRRVGHGHI